MKLFNIAVVGASGAVGDEIFRSLEETKIPIKSILPLASSKSIGKKIEFNGISYDIGVLKEDSFRGKNIDIAFFSAGGTISSHFVKFAVESGAVVIDNTSYFRMRDNIPLVVPEVNPKDISSYKNSGIISNPNCSTIQMVQVLKPLYEVSNITRVDVSTYQAVSGIGKKGMDELIQQMKDLLNFKIEDSKKDVFGHQIAVNVIPHIDYFWDNGYSNEEMKMSLEARKILHNNINISATCVRVPVLRCHGESLSISFEDDVRIDDIIFALNKAENVKILDNIKENKYPMPVDISTKSDTFVGRIRRDLYKKNTIHLWCVADQLKVGAALNAVRIAQILIRDL